MSFASSAWEARFVVAKLGEAAITPWWKTAVMTPAGERFLERLFPRTYRIAAIETAGRAAAIVHDERIGRIGSYHLFRLPLADEVLLHEALRQPESGERLADLAPILDRGALLGRLADLAEPSPPTDASGPVYCGTTAEIHRRGLARACAAYLAGFETDRPVYPYFQDATS